MLLVDFEGRTNLIERGLIRGLSQFVADKYFPRHKVHILFKMSSILEENDGVEGDTTWEYNDKDDEPFLPISNDSRPRCFVIRLQKGYNTETLLTLIAHELVHVKQYVLGDLKQIYNKSQNEFVTFYKSKNVSKMEYWKQPFEKEAYRLQDKIVKEYLKHINSII